MKYLIALMLLLTATAASLNAAETKKPAEASVEAPVTSSVIEDTITITTDNDETPTKADPAFGVKHTEVRIVKLPQDANRPFLSIYGKPDDPKVKQLKTWFDKNAELHGIKVQSHYNFIDMTQRGNIEKYGPSIPALPCVRIQEFDGKPVYQVSGKNIPMSAEAMSKSTNTELFRRWRNWRNRNDDEFRDRNNDRNDRNDGQPDNGLDDEENDYGDNDNAQPDKDASPEVEAIGLAIGILALGFVGLTIGGIIAIVLKNNNPQIPKG